MNEYINKKIKKIKEIVDEYGFNMDKTLDMISAIQKMMELSVEMLKEVEPYAVNKIKNMEITANGLGDLYYEMEDMMNSIEDPTYEMISEDDAKKIHEKILEVFYEWHILKDNGKIYLVNDNDFDNHPNPEELSYQYLLDNYEMDKIIESDSYLDALSEWKDSIEVDIENMGLFNEEGEWDFYLTPDEILATGVSMDFLKERFHDQLEDDFITKVDEACLVMEEAIQIGILEENPQNPNHIFVFINYDNGQQGWASRNKLEAAIDLVNQDAVSILKNEISNIKENGYQKNISSFIKNITIEDVDVLNKLDNLVGGGQISDDIYYLFDEELQNKLAEKIIECVKSKQDTIIEELEIEMQKFTQWYDEAELKDVDYSDALYNCDGIYLEAISDCIGVPMEDLAEYEIDFNDFVLKIAQDHDLKEIEKIKKLAFIQWKFVDEGIDMDFVYLNSDNDMGASIVNPWMDPTGRFEVDPVEEYGAKAFKQFCNDMKEKMNDILSHTLKLKYDKFEKENQPSFDANKQKQLEAMTKLHNIGLDADPEYRYQILSRLKQDCDYYLGNGNRFTKHLWASDEKEQIVIMRYLYDSFLEEDKPEWINIDMINSYEERMCNNIEEEEEYELE